MRRLDRLHLEFPFAGSRMLRGLLAAEGCKIGRRHVKTLMQRMGIEALYRRPRTTKPEPGHKIYPYLLRGMAIARPNQVWAMDITYIPMARGFVYLAVVLDWFSRRVLSWRLSITMEAAFCVETLEDALAVTASRTSSTPTRAAVHRHGLHRRARQQRHRDQHGRQGRLARQRVRRAAVAQRQIRGGVSARPTTASARPALRSAATWTSTTAADRIRALTARHPIKPTSPAASPLGSLTPADAPLIDAENLFRQPGPPRRHNGFRFAMPISRFRRKAPYCNWIRGFCVGRHVARERIHV